MIFHTLEFDGINSLDNGVYITGEAVYNAPERAVEMVSIAGRNGAFALDMGRFENVTVTYPAGAFGSDQADFAKKMRSFRNMMASKIGYKRLVDTYNPDEYRLAIFKDAIEVAPFNGKAGEFELVFDCKPQRFLMSGEAEMSVNNGDSVFNPTPFDAKPMLIFDGYGDIHIGDDVISVENVPYGQIQIAGAGKTDRGTIQIVVSTSRLMSGDVFTLSGLVAAVQFQKKPYYTNIFSSTVDQTNCTTHASDSETARWMNIDQIDFQYGTAKTVTASWTYNLYYTYGGSSTTQTNRKIRVTVSYDGDATITIDFAQLDNCNPFNKVGTEIKWNSIWGDSTMTALNGVHIDLDLGEVWNEVSGEISSLNNVVVLPAELPVLKSGSNEITYDNTITDLKIIPRWWIV